MVSAPQHRFVTASNGIRLHYLEWPREGPTAVLVHATSFCAEVWTPLAETLSRDWRVIAPDQRGHGQSEKPDSTYSWGVNGEDLAGLADVLGLRDVLAVGHSTGAIATFHAAALRPGFARGLVLVEPGSIAAHYPDGGSKWDEQFGRTRKRRAEWPSRGDAFQYLRQRPPFNRWRPDVLRLYVEGGTEVLADGRAALRCPPEIEARVYEGRVLFDAWPYVGRLDMPTVLVVGLDSHMQLTMESAPIQRWLRLAPQTQVVWMPDATHYAPQDQPEAFERIVVEFAEHLSRG